MAYEKQEWKARRGAGLNKFTKSGETETVVYLENTPDAITEPGTLFSPEAMNRIEQGIEDAHEEIAAEAGARKAAIDAAKEYMDAEITKNKLAVNEWLAPVKTVSQIPATGLDSTRNYLIKAVADPVKSGVYQAIAGWTDEPEWVLYNDTVDFVDEQEMAAAIQAHDTDTAAHEDIRVVIQKINEDYVNEGDVENAVNAHNQDIASHNELSNALLEKINSKIDKNVIGAPNGIASLDPQAKVPLDQLPDVIAGDFSSLIEQLEAIRSDTSNKYLPPNTDFNDLKEPGFYYNHRDVESQTMPNHPSQTNMVGEGRWAFGLTVQKAAGVIQIWYWYENPNIEYRRRYYDVLGTWSGWGKHLRVTAPLVLTSDNSLYVNYAMANNTNYPVGTYLLIREKTPTSTNVPQNSQVALWTTTSSVGQKDQIHGQLYSRGGNTFTGEWRIRGIIANLNSCFIDSERTALVLRVA